MFINDFHNPEIAKMALELAASKASHSQLIAIHKKTKADLESALKLICELKDHIKIICRRGDNPIKNACLACGGNHGGLTRQKMTITGKFEG